MAPPVEPPPLGVWLRNVKQDLPSSRTWPGTCSCGPRGLLGATLSECNPSLLQEAQGTSALGTDVHGYETVGTVVTAPNPSMGELYDETLHRARDVPELVSLVLEGFPTPRPRPRVA